MALEEYPPWTRGFDIVIGFVIIFVGAWIILNTFIVEATLVFLLALGLLVIGFTKLSKGLLLKQLNTTTRTVKAVSGIGAIALALAAILLSSLTVTVLITLLTFGLMLVGIARIIVGYMETGLKSEMRIANIVGGGLVFLFGFAAAIFPSLGLYTLKLLLAITFLVLGSLRVASGASGELR
ncbi:MAG: hypothetical protein ACFFCT_07440 [Candidatus Odinarchaeota archaeon]|nr:hypothetical protein [Candidatus Thorarchaeota archaeon]